MTDQDQDQDQDQDSQFESVLELLSDHGFDGMREAMETLFNDANDIKGIFTASDDAAARELLRVFVVRYT